MSLKRIAVGGSAANPPHLGHKNLVKLLLNSGLFDQVVWIPSGVRPEKPDFVDPDHRVAMTIMTFPTAWWQRSGTTLRINFGDVYGDNTPTIEHLERLKTENPDSEIVWFTGVDSVVPTEEFNGRCEIEAVWTRGEELMKNWPFLILPRPGFPHPSTINLPNQFQILDVKQIGITSTQVKELIRQDHWFDYLVTKSVARYIKHYGLYGWKENS